MKLNYKMFKMVTTEPFLVQEILGRRLEMHYLNDTNFLAENVMKGRFYVWSSDGKDFKLFVEKGFYEKTGYFFEEKINTIWLNFLIEASKVRGKLSPYTLAFSFIPLFVAIGGYMLKPEFGTIFLIAGFVLSLIINMTFSSRLNTKVRELNQKAHIDIRDALTEKQFNQFFEDQKDYSEIYYRENFGEDTEVEDEETLLVEDTEVVDAEVEVVEIEADVIENEVDYNKMTVAELKELAESLNLTGYSSLRKAELIDLIKENK